MVSCFFVNSSTMKRFFTAMVLCFFLGGGGTEALSREPYLKVEEVLQKIIRNREQIRSGHICFTTSADVSDLEFKYEIFFDYPKILMRLTEPSGSFNSPNSTLPSDYPRSLSFLDNGKIYATHIQELREPFNRIVATVVEDYSDPHDDSELPKNLIDPRMMGLVPYNLGLWHTSKWDVFLKLPGNFHREVLGTPVSNKAPLRLRFTSDYLTVVLLISPDQNYSVKGIIADYGKYTEEMHCSLDQYPFGDSTIWFPRKINLWRTVKGKRSGQSEIRISDVSFNIPIPAALFTLEGMELPEGTLINYVSNNRETGKRSKKNKLWSKGKAVSITNSDSRVRRIPKPSEKEFVKSNHRLGKTLLYFNVFVVGAICVIIAYLRIRNN